MTIPVALFLLDHPTEHVGVIESTGAAPTITSDGGGATADVSVSTGDTAVTTVVASDTGTITYSIVGGAEALMFEIDPDTGELAFTETSVDGEYEVIVAATSDWGVDTQTITVTVEEAYHADAVHFDTTDFLSIASLTCTDNEFYSFSMWAKVGVDIVDIFVADKNNNFWPSLSLIDPSRQLLVLIGASGGVIVYGANTVGAIGAGWVHVLGSFEAPGTFALYITDVLATLENESAPEDPFNIQGNGLTFQLNNNTAMDLADVWIAPGVSLLSGGAIPEATRRKFISAEGKPVYLGADGSTPTGVAPAVFFSGDAVAFPTNLGTGGAFTLTGVLTDASTSPSD